MQLSNGRVWDYVGDNYVHRLIQNKEDGKLVEMDERGQHVSDEKMDSLTLEVTMFASFPLHVTDTSTQPLAAFSLQFNTHMIECILHVCTHR